ncbi:kinesin-related protein 4 isoform X2 [Patella vulgata]|uniref:kinesin-related protein 4 isoform X2 n=1 Tax=Patella vulgata TaxID=6465 RepID=UPI0021807AB3|nr:kinesin-related protein 4 isoform X2 [Patella vulgata]
MDNHEFIREVANLRSYYPQLSNFFEVQCIMADNDSDRDQSFDSTTGTDNEILQKHIKKLEKEKADIERKNREKELLEQKLKSLKETVSALKSPGKVSSPGSSNHGSGRKSRKDASPNMNFSNLSDAVTMLKNKLDKSLQSDEDESDSNNESDKSSEEEKEEVMSAHHKQKIQKNRDVLVENMIPDDIFNDLIACKILTTADVGRIKKKSSTRESINEELVNNLVLKSDRAFYVFTKALRKTLQEYLANLLDPPPKKKKKRKRQQKEMNISVDVEDVAQVNSKQPTCSCQEVEEQILLLSKNAYKTIRRRDQSAAAFEQFRKELAQTNAVIKDSMEIMNTLKILCRHGDLNGVFRGSVKFTILISSVEALNDLWTMFKSGKLLSVLQSSLITDNMKKYFLVKDIRLGVRISEEEYKACLGEFIQGPAVNINRRKTEKSNTVSSQDCPCFDIENSPSPKSFPLHSGPRRAFSEIIIRSQEVPSVYSDLIKESVCEKCLTSTSYHLRSHPYKS